MVHLLWVYVLQRKQTQFSRIDFLNDIPREVRELLEKKQIANAVEEGLSIENYTSFFKNLVIMEEIQLEVTFYLRSEEQ